MASLFEINSKLEELLFTFDELIMNGEEPSKELHKTIEELAEAEAEKIDNYCSFISKLKSEITSIQERKQFEVAAFDKEIKKRSRTIERLAEIARTIMERRGIVKMTGEKGHSLSLRPAQNVQVYNQELIPEEFLRVTKEPDRVAIKQAFKEGTTINGCSVVTNYSVQVK